MPVFDPVGLAIHHLLNILMSKQLENQREIVGVDEKLRQVLKLENI
jgi:hypothetical protein